MAVCKVLSFGQNTFGNVFTKYWNIHQRSISKIRIITELMGYPCEPKRPLNPFFRFLQQCRSDSPEEYRSLKPPEFIKEMSKRWSTMSGNEKEKFIKEFEKEKSAYIIELDKYNENLSTADKEKIRNLSKEIKSQKTLKIPCVVSNKVKRELNKPKPPLQTFIRFSKKFNIKNGKSNAINMKFVSEEWRNLPDSEKQKYKEEYKKEFDEYAKNLQKWEENMLKEGKVEVIRLKTLIQMLQKKHS